MSTIKPKLKKEQLDNTKNGIDVIYNGRLLTYEEQTTKLNTRPKPIVNFKKRNGKLYTIMMVDPDSRSPETQEFKYFLHWLAVNISTESANGNAINKYSGPNPPIGLHRYYICVLEQKNEIINMNEFPRPKFNVGKFINSNNLRLISCMKFFVEADKKQMSY